MSGSFEKSVKGATKIKLAPPKSKYIEHLLVATHSGEHGVAEVFRTLQYRLRDSTWTVVFKSLITVHLMIREGAPEVVLAFLSQHKNMLAVSSFSDVQTQGRNIRHYSNYLSERARGYRDTKCDYVRGADRRLELLTVNKGLLRETETIQHQITALLKCDVLNNEPENEITVTVFRMLILDLLAMFHVMNQAMINLLGHFFEMSKPDAERAMEIYRNFTRQTDFVVGYLAIARQYQHQTRVEVPTLKHAPVNLGRQLEDYLKDPDFDNNRQQYLAEQDGKKGKFASKQNGRNQSKTRAATGRAFPDAKPMPESPSKAQSNAAPVVAATKTPIPDLIDFFGSIEQHQTQMAQHPNPQSQYTNAPTQFPQQGAITQQSYQQTGFMQPQSGFLQQFSPQPQANNGLHGMQQPPPSQQLPHIQQPQQLQPDFTGAGFGGYTPQPMQMSTPLMSGPQAASPFAGQQLGVIQPQNTNPFRQSMMPAAQTQPPRAMTLPLSSPELIQSTNPFAQSMSTSSLPQAYLIPPPQQQQPTGFSVSQQQSPPPLIPTATGTNPFAKHLQMASPPPTAGLAPQPTGNTNPFRQSQFVNTTTGMSWQHNQGIIGGGLDTLGTVPVFPRPNQQPAWGS